MANIVSGGHPVYGETVGILMLDTQFPRIHGDIGNARTFPFPVRFQIVSGATTDRIVADADRARALLPAFIEAARALEASGVKAITTSCGFLTVVQAELAAAVSVPVITSSLFLVPLVRQMIGSRPIGIITAHSGALSQRHLSACGIDPTWPVHVRGMENTHAFNSAILGRSDGQPPQLDVDGATREVADLCADLKTAVPDLGAFVFECTNLQPYAQAAQAVTGLPAFGIYHVVQLLHAASRAPRFDGEI